MSSVDIVTKVEGDHITKLIPFISLNLHTSYHPHSL